MLRDQRYDIMDLDPGKRHTCIQILTLALNDHLICGKLLHAFNPFPYLYAVVSTVGDLYKSRWTKYEECTLNKL